VQTSARNRRNSAAVVASNLNPRVFTAKYLKEISYNKFKKLEAFLKT